MTLLEYRGTKLPPETAEGVALIAATLRADSNLTPYLVGGGTVEEQEDTAPETNEPRVWIVVREPMFAQFDSSVKVVEAPYEIVVRSSNPADSSAYSPYTSILATNEAIYKSLVGAYLAWTRAAQRAPLRRGTAPTPVEFWPDDNHYESVSVYRALLVTV